MKIYTKTGDKGTTSLYSGERVSKNHPRPEAYGTVDELNASLGAVIAQLRTAPESLVTELQGIQSTLFRVGSCLATTPESAKLMGLKELVSEDWEALERAIDRMTADMPPLVGFILPGGHPSAAAAHIARTVCRRAERRVIDLVQQLENDGAYLENVITFINRLADYLFTLARYCNHVHGAGEAPPRRAD